MTCLLVLILSAVFKSLHKDADAVILDRLRINPVDWKSEAVRCFHLELNHLGILEQPISNCLTCLIPKHTHAQAKSHIHIHWPELCRLMLRRLGKSRRRISLLSWMEAKLLLAMTRVSRLGNMEPNLRTSAQSLRLLSVMWSRRKLGQATLEALTLLYSLRHRNNSSSLQDNTAEDKVKGEEDWLMNIIHWIPNIWSYYTL